MNNIKEHMEKNIVSKEDFRSVIKLADSKIVSMQKIILELDMSNDMALDYKLMIENQIRDYRNSLSRVETFFFLRYGEEIEYEL